MLGRDSACYGEGSQPRSETSKDVDVACENELSTSGGTEYYLWGAIDTQDGHIDYVQRTPVDLILHTENIQSTSTGSSPEPSCEEGQRWDEFSCNPRKCVNGVVLMQVVNCPEDLGTPCHGMWKDTKYCCRMCVSSGPTPPSAISPPVAHHPFPSISSHPFSPTNGGSRIFPDVGIGGQSVTGVVPSHIPLMIDCDMIFRPADCAQQFGCRWKPGDGIGECDEIPSKCQMTRDAIYGAVGEAPFNPIQNCAMIPGCTWFPGSGHVNPKCNTQGASQAYDYAQSFYNQYTSGQYYLSETHRQEENEFQRAKTRLCNNLGTMKWCSKDQACTWVGSSCQAKQISSNTNSAAHRSSKSFNHIPCIIGAFFTGLFGVLVVQHFRNPAKKLDLANGSERMI